MTRRQIAQSHQRLGDAADVGSRAIPISLQQTPDAGLLHHVLGEIEIERGKCVGCVAHHLDRSSSGPEHYQGAKGRIDRHAENKLMRARAADHGLHREAFDPAQRA